MDCETVREAFKSLWLVNNPRIEQNSLSFVASWVYESLKKSDSANNTGQLEVNPKFSSFVRVYDSKVEAKELGSK